MARSVVLLIIGAIAGSAAFYLLGGRGQSPYTAVSASADTPSVPTAAPAPPEAESFASERLAVYAAAAETTNSLDLESMIRSAAGEQPSRSRRLRLTALLSRLAEIDPRRALEVARSQYLDTAFFVPLYETWAQRDPDAAIADLATVRPPPQQRLLALAVLGVIGNDREGLDQIAAVLAPADRAGFEIDALVEKARVNPAQALRELIDLPSATLRSVALPRIVDVAARLDPAGTMALAGTIDDYSMREAYTSSALEAWSELDPDGAFDWLESVPQSEIPQYAAAYQTLAASDVDRLLELSEGLPLDIRRYVQSVAMQVLAERDPNQAIALLDSMPPGQERDQMIGAIAQAYGRQNPEAALAWAKQLTPPSSTALGAVLQGMLAVDPERAIDLMVTEIDNAGSGNMNAVSPYLSLIFSIGTTENIDVGRVLDRLVGIDNQLMSSMLGSTIGNWARQQPEAALNWALANASRLDPSTFGNMAQSIANTDPDLALSLLDRLPPAQQAGWVEGLVSQLTQTDPNRALGLVERLRGGPGYGAAYAAVARTMARSNPAEAARLLSTGPSIPQNELTNAVYNISREWASQDPLAAAQWATNLVDATVRTRAVSMVVQQWAQSDSNRARQWLLSMNGGEVRDSGLGAYMNVAAQMGRFDADLIDAFSTELQGQQAAGSAIVQMGRSDPEEARRLLDLHITDPAVRRTTEANLARTGGAGGGSIMPSIIF